MGIDDLPEAVCRAIESGEAAARVAGWWEPQYGVFADLRPEVLRTRELITFLRGCEATNRFAVLMTDPDAKLSPFVVSALRDHGAYWVLHRHGGPVVAARTGAELTSYEDMWQQPVPMPVTKPRGEVTVLAFDVVAEHRADERTEIGPLASGMIALLGGGALQTWGQAEPLTRPFAVADVTRTAREQMPDTEPLLFGDAYGSWAETTVSRTDTGVRERVRGGVAQASDALAQRRGSDALRSLADSQHRILTATVSALRPAAGPSWRAGTEHLEHLVAAYVGPAVLGRSSKDASAVAEQCGGALVGRTRVPGLLVELTGSAQQRADDYLTLVRQIAPREDIHDVALGA